MNEVNAVEVWNEYERTWSVKCLKCNRASTRITISYPYRFCPYCGERFNYEEAKPRHYPNDVPDKPDPKEESDTDKMLYLLNGIYNTMQRMLGLLKDD